jgi:hypothetical protein
MYLVRLFEFFDFLPLYTSDRCLFSEPVFYTVDVVRTCLWAFLWTSFVKIVISLVDFYSPGVCYARIINSCLILYLVCLVTSLVCYLVIDDQSIAQIPFHAIQVTAYTLTLVALLPTYYEIITFQRRLMKKKAPTTKR